MGRDRHLAVFEKYSLLEEIGCRLTQAGPVFLVREGAETYEVKGYEVFYHDNEQMQTYLIERKQGNNGQDQEGDSTGAAKNIGSDRIKDRGVPSGTMQGHTQHRQISHSAISVQLSIILVILVAIVINSTNSYDKMQQLNQSATEVFFAMENQEAEQEGRTGNGQKDIVAERVPAQDEDVLKLAALENSQQSDAAETEADEGETEETENGTASQATDEAELREKPGSDEKAGTEEETDTTGQETDAEAHPSESAAESSAQEEQEEVEALSRNVARYYKVERGDTLYTISQKIYGDTAHVQKICELNQITDPDRIRYGQKIILP